MARCGLGRIRQEAKAVLYVMVWHGIAQDGIVWHCMAWFGTALAVDGTITVCGSGAHGIWEWHKR